MQDEKELLKLIKRSTKKSKFVAVIQREPYVHVKTKDGIKLEEVAGGAHILMDGILKETGGVMVALASGDADKLTVDEFNRVQVPPKDPKYTLHRVFITPEQREGFYYGFANQTLWPLCHVVFIKPIFHESWWETYKEVNTKFAEAILQETNNEEAIVWINDYHLALVPGILKARNPKLKIGTFWHIPWPTHEIYRIFPWRKEILTGLLGSDFIGFHRGYHVDNFVESCRRELGVFVDSEPRSIEYKEHRTKLENVPAGIDYNVISEVLSNIKDIDKQVIKRDFGVLPEHLLIGVDRVDYTKGILERLQAIDVFLEKYPEFIGKFTYLGFGAPSRTKIPAYKALNTNIDNLISKINAKYSTKKWQPIIYINTIVSRRKIFEYYRAADAGIITSLDDGMNLVAKEFVLCCHTNQGTLILSKFTGAARDLKQAIQINPYDINETARAIYTGLTMNRKEKELRMREMKEIVKKNNTYRWAIQFIENIVKD